MMNLDRRQVLRAAGLGVATLALAPMSALAADEKPKGYTLPKLPYDYDALEPHIDAETMKIHHGKHHLAYITTANNLLKSEPKLLAMPVDDLLADVSKVPEKIRQGVINSAGGHSNHTIFWEIMGPKAGGEPKGVLGRAITKAFGSFAKFQKELTEKAQTQFGSGWAWLVADARGALSVVQRPNQNSPYMDGLTPILGLDVWEHAYYLKYQNRRPDHTAAVVDKLLNWDFAAEQFAKAGK